MADPLAELSSVASDLDDLTTRISRIAEGFTERKHDDVATSLYEVERALDGARRRLSQLLDRR